MKFLPPDDPTAVYPIGSMKNDPTDGDGSSTPAPERPRAEPVKDPTPPGDLGEVAAGPSRPRGARTATPRPGGRLAQPGAKNPIILAGGALAVGFLLAAAVLAVIALFLFLFQ